jgi:InsA N-terminal domain
MVLISVLCPHCHSDQVIKGGKTKTGQQRYKCQNTGCPRYSFQLDLFYKGRAPAIKEQIVDMKQYLDSLRRKDSLSGAETARISVCLEYYSASHFEGSAISFHCHETGRFVSSILTTFVTVTH